MNVFTERNLLLAAELEKDIEQTTGRLKDIDGSRCCLGVACDVFNRETGQGEWKLISQINSDSKTFIDNIFFCVDNTESESKAPLAVQKWFGWTRGNPMIKINSESLSAAEFNDAGYSFKQIAEGFKALADWQKEVYG